VEATLDGRVSVIPVILVAAAPVGVGPKDRLHIAIVGAVPILAQMVNILKY